MSTTVVSGGGRSQEGTAWLASRRYDRAMASVTRSQAGVARKRRSESISRVLASVEALLEEGTLFTELPVLRIAEESGIARSTFYQYFPNKSQLLIQVAAVTSDTFLEAATAWFSDAESYRGGAATVEKVIGTMLREYRQHVAVMRAVGELASYDPEVAGFWFGRINSFIDLSATRVQKWQHAGAVREDLDPVETTAALTWMVGRAISQHVLYPRDPLATDARLAKSLAQVIWRSLFDSSIVSTPR
jgi:AcrR family transcriptional regulator